MRFSTRTRSGLRFLLRLAHERPNLVTLSQVAAAENISLGYLEQIVHTLKPLEIFRSVRGSGGGYSLCKGPDEIVLEDVFMCLEGTISPVACLEDETQCDRSTSCSMRLFWRDFEVHTRAFLRTKTLQTLLESTESSPGGTHVGLHPGCT